MLQVPLGQTGELKKIICWEFEGTAFDQGDDAATWFSKYLGAPHRLVRYAGKHVNFCSPYVSARCTDLIHATAADNMLRYALYVDVLQLSLYPAHR